MVKKGEHVFCLGDSRTEVSQQAQVVLLAGPLRQEVRLRGRVPLHPRVLHQPALPVIFKVYDIDDKGKVTFKDLVEVLRDLTGSSMSEQQRETIDLPGLKMEVEGSKEVPID